MNAQGEATVFIVDDDPAARRLIAALVRAKQVRAETYASAEEFLGAYDGSPGCLVTDLRMKGMTGLELQQLLKTKGIKLPVIVVTAFADVPTAVTVMKAGAVGFLEKPWRGEELWSSIKTGLDIARLRRQQEERQADIQQRISQLTPDETRVLNELVAGKPNKLIATELDIGLRTVELRRSNIFKKMKAESLAELVQMVLLARHDDANQHV
jgi:FixJ family two-component response regulator